MNQNYLLPFDSLALEPDLLPLLGGKAERLVRLAQAGFPVPSGFCLLASAYQQHLVEHNLENQIAALLKRRDLPRQARADQTQEAILSQPLPAGVRQAIQQAYTELSGGDPALAVAVRSSAWAEDGQFHSFAGQYSTFLNICGVDNVLEAVQKCWASVWSGHALAYRQQVNEETQSPAVAVIVQKMVSAEAAGVVFTTNPMTGADEVVIEAVSGLGEGLVSGEQTPERYFVDKANPSSEAGSAFTGQRSILSAHQVSRLVDLALRVEAFFGSPQDIEWATEGGEFYLLQSRPVTSAADTRLVKNGQVDMEALLQRAEQTGGEIWTDDNVGEVFPDPVTPLTWSVLEPLGNQSFRYFLRRLGFKKYPSQGLFGLFYGRVYFNQSQFQRVVSRFFPSRLSKKGSRLTWLRLKGALAMILTGLRAAWWIPFLPGQARRLMKEVSRQVDNARQPAELADTQLWETIAYWREMDRRVMELHLSVTIFAALMYDLLEKLVRRWTKGSLHSAHLVASLPEMQSASAGRDLKKLADMAVSYPDLLDGFDHQSPGKLSAYLETLPPWHPFIVEFSRYLQLHGHSSLHEFELAFPRWVEEPGYLLAALRSLMKSSRTRSTGGEGESQLQTREEMALKLDQHIPSALQRLVVQWVLNWTQIYTELRENLKYHFLKSHAYLRRLYLRVGENLVQEQLLFQVEDVFYLRHAEIASLPGHQVSRDELAEKVKQRQTELEEFRNHVERTPNLIEQLPDGSLRPLVIHMPRSEDDAKKQADGYLFGVAASAGRFVGRARVVTGSEGPQVFEPGEVLVTRATNPAWSPHLLSAGALVTEIGGLLSHGAILAREYGLPAVLNVKDATGLIQTGQVIEVNGDRGTVHVLDRGKPV